MKHNDLFFRSYIRTYGTALCLGRPLDGPKTFTSLHFMASTELPERHLKQKKLLFFPLFFTGVKLGLSHWGKTIDRKYMRRRSWGEYLKLWQRKKQEVGENYMRKFVIFTLRHPSRWSNEECWSWWETQHAWKKWELCTKYWLEDLNERNNLEDLGVRGSVLLEWILEN